MNDLEFTWSKPMTELANKLYMMQTEISRLKCERDEARREVCWFHHLTGFLAGDYANSRDWNYLNDERKWPKSPQSVTDFKLFLEGQDKIFLEMNDRLRAERDELQKQVDELLDEKHAPRGAWGDFCNE